MVSPDVGQWLGIASCLLWTGCLSISTPIKRAKVKGQDAWDPLPVLPMSFHVTLDMSLFFSGPLKSMDQYSALGWPTVLVCQGFAEVSTLWEAPQSLSSREVGHSTRHISFITTECYYWLFQLIMGPQISPLTSRAFPSFPCAKLQRGLDGL